MYTYIGSFNSKRSEVRGAKGFLAERTRSSFCIYRNRLQRIKSLKMVVESSDKNNFLNCEQREGNEGVLAERTRIIRFLLSCPEYISKIDPARPWRSLTAYISDSIIDTDVKFRHNFNSSLKIVLSKFGKLFAFFHRWNFENIWKFYIITFKWVENFEFW